MPATDFTITNLERLKLGNAFMNIMNIEFGSTFEYPQPGGADNGILVTPAQMGVNVVTGLAGIATTGHYARYRPADERIEIYVSGGAQVANANEDLRNETIVLTVLGT